MIALWIAAAACLLFAFVQLALAWRVRSKVPLLSTLDAPTPRAWPRLSIVVPARDEAAGIEAALASKLACGYPELEIIVVDDRSTDGTGDIARRLAEKDPRLAVTRIDELPDGWLGKVHAMSIGASHATGEWLLLSDADVHILPGTLERVVAHAEAHDIDLLALMPRMDRAGWLIDACVAGMLRLLALAGRSWAANDDRSSVGVGVGAFNLVRRAALERTPGLVDLRMEMADDVALGAMLKRCGARCRFAAARESVHLVFAESVGVLARGLEKGGGLVGFSLVRTLVVTLIWLAVDLGVPLAAIAAGGPLAGLGIAQLVLVTATHAVVSRRFGAPMRGVLLWPVGGVLGIAMFARSGILAWWRGEIVWRGTRYGKAQIEGGRRWQPFQTRPLTEV
jgi:hypothetical protein